MGRDGEQQFERKLGRGLRRAGTVGGGLPMGRTAAMLPAQEGAGTQYSLILSHLILVGASWSLMSFCPSFVPLFKTLIDPLPLLLSTATTVRNKTVPALKSQEASDNRKCW